MSSNTITSTPKQENREFIRHPSDIPIEYCLTNQPFCNMDVINDVSKGGLSFHSDHYVEPMTWLRLHIPIHEEHFEVDAQVRWCRSSGDGCSYNIGVLFASSSSAFSARMVEQVCHIEHYKRQVFAENGRQLSGDEAAAEWIEKYATDFPARQSDHIVDDLLAPPELIKH